LLFVQELSALNFLSVLAFFNLPEQRLLFVLGSLLLGDELVLLFGDSALLRFDIKLNINFHASVLLCLTLSLQLFFVSLELLDLIFV